MTCNTKNNYPIYSQFTDIHMQAIKLCASQKSLYHSNNKIKIRDMAFSVSLYHVVEKQSDFDSINCRNMVFYHA